MRIALTLEQVFQRQLMQDIKYKMYSMHTLMDGHLYRFVCLHMLVPVQCDVPYVMSADLKPTLLVLLLFRV